MRWPNFHTCHPETKSITPEELESIPLMPAKNAKPYGIDDKGLRVCPVCESLHPQDLYRALTEDGATLTAMSSDGGPLRYRISGQTKAATHFFHTLHLGDHGYDTEALRALCRELSKQGRFIWEPDVDGVYWRPKEEVESKAGRSVLKLSKKFRVNLDAELAPPGEPEPDPISLDDWKKSMEADVRQFKKDKRGW